VSPNGRVGRARGATRNRTTDRARSDCRAKTRR